VTQTKQPPGNPGRFSTIVGNIIAAVINTQPVQYARRDTNHAPPGTAVQSLIPRADENQSP
jgi:hypothetical protein